MRAYLPFEKMPLGFVPGQSVTVLQIALSGVQAFIFSDQSIYGSGDLLAAKSAYIVRLTEKLNKLFCEQFAPGTYTVLSCSSGKLIAAVTGNVHESRLMQFADDVQLDVFSETKGILQMNYAMEKAVVCHVEHIPPKTENVSAILAMKIGRSKYQAAHLLCNGPRKIPACAEQMPAGKSVIAPTQDCVAIKLDLDNLGTFFSSLTAFDVQKAASEALDRVIRSCTDRAVYMGGDDIFAIVPLSEGLPAIADMYRKLSDGIQNDPRLQPYKASFSISGGAIRIPFANGNVPAAYYFSESEEMLKKAKVGKNRICIEGSLYSWEDILRVADLLEKHRQTLTEQVGQRFMPIYYLNPRQIARKLKELNLLR